MVVATNAAKLIKASYLKGKLLKTSRLWPWKNKRQQIRNPQNLMTIGIKGYYVATNPA
jgi:hypothetical protein